MTEPSNLGAAQDTERAERRAEWRAATGFCVSTAAALGLAGVYIAGGQPQLEGLFIGVSLGGMAFGLITWANRLLPPGPVVDHRPDLATSAEERRALQADVGRAGGTTRRRLLSRTFGLAIVALGVAALFPIRSLGPNPGTSLLRTPWRGRQGRGPLRLVTADGTPVRADDVPLGGLVTVFPEDTPGSADGQAVLVRVPEPLIQPKPGRETWTPQGLVAYSKLCTHAGCPVGLYQAGTYELLCPCHQSNFDVLRHARPGFGPAAAPLPQLPLAIDDDGFVVATGDFSEPVGPAFWHRS